VNKKDDAVTPQLDARVAGPGLERRNFLRLAGLTVGALTLGGAGLTLAQGDEGGPQGAVAKGAVDLGALSSVKTGQALDRSQDLKLVLTHTTQGLIALSTTCTHQGCSTAFTTGAQQFICPCHRASFAADGSVVNRPARVPLSRYPVSLKGGRIIVDTNKLIARTTVQASDFIKS
jgi:cytochrome b6-f complex iron-sulfur subunit